MSSLEPIPSQQILDAMNFRHATKVFDASKKIPEDEFNLILEAARLSPSSFGAEPWQILVVQDPEKRAKLRDCAWGATGALNGTEGQLATASHFCVILAHTAKTMKYDAGYLFEHMRDVKHFPEDILKGFLVKYQEFQEKDFALKTDRNVIDWSARQAYITLGNAMTVAAMRGIDSCPIEGFDIAQTSKTLQEHFDVNPERFVPAVMVGFGYRQADPKRPKTRREMANVVKWF